MWKVRWEEGGEEGGKLKQTKSVGIIVFKRFGNKARKFLLLHYEAGHWDFPKGGVEEKESEKETALRELSEETGLTQVVFVPRFREAINYFFTDEGELIKKAVAYYLGEVSRSDVALSFEHTDFKWLSFGDAVKQLTYANSREVLRKANSFLEKISNGSTT